MPTLLQINVDSGIFSTGKISDDIAKLAISRGWDCYTAYGRDFRSGYSKPIKIGNRFSIIEHYLESRISDNEGRASRISTYILIKRIKELSPDIIHLHVIHDHYINYRILFNYLIKSNAKIVWTFHDCWAITGHCMHFVTKNCRRWETGCYQCLMHGEYPFSIFNKCDRNWKEKKSLFTANPNMNIVVCSSWIADYVKTSYLKNFPIYTFHNGIDINVFKPLSLNKPKRIFTILAISSVWTTDKGFLDVIKLRNLLPQEIHMVIVGVNKEQKSLLPGDILSIERTHDIAELVKYYNDANVLINPTYADTFPTINLEALACGTPVITYKTGGSPEAICDENILEIPADKNIIFYETGAVVKQGDVNALADAILYFKEHPCSVESCRKRAENLFDKDRCFARYIELYEELLKVNKA